MNHDVSGGNGDEDAGNGIAVGAMSAGEEEEQLALANEDEDLPWLEADDYEEEQGFDWRLITHALIGLAVLARCWRRSWWFTRDRADPELVADGSTIEAPEGAYKQRPDDAGGAEVEGTGDQALKWPRVESARGRIDSGDARRQRSSAFYRYRTGWRGNRPQPPATASTSGAV